MVKVLAGLLFLVSSALHADTIRTERLTTVQTTVYDEATSQYLIYGPVAMEFTYDEQTYGFGMTVPIAQFSLAGFTSPSLYLYPHSGGFDGLDVLGSASSGDSLVFGYAFGDGSLSTSGVHPGFRAGDPDVPLLTVTGAPEPSSFGLFAVTLFAATFLFKSFRVSRKFSGRTR